MREGVISDYGLERYFLGELSPEEAGTVGRAASADPSLRAALDGIERSNRDILALYPPAAFKEDLLARLRHAEERTPARARGQRRLLAFASAAAVIVLAAVMTIPRIRKIQEPGPSGTDRTVVKGEASLDLSKTQLLVFRKHGDRAEIMADGNEAETGALLQLAYVSAAEAHGIILSIDGRGNVFRHFPVEEGGPTDLVLNRKSLLPNAIELDDAPGFERFFLVTSDVPIDVAGVLAQAAVLARDPALARGSDLDLPPGLKQKSILILKGKGSR